jgi:hypothetical protein
VVQGADHRERADPAAVAHGLHEPVVDVLIVLDRPAVEAIQVVRDRVAGTVQRGFQGGELDVLAVVLHPKRHAAPRQHH